MENHNYEKSILTAGEGGPGEPLDSPIHSCPFSDQSLAWRGLCEPAGGGPR